MQERRVACGRHVWRHGHVRFVPHVCEERPRAAREVRRRGRHVGRGVPRDGREPFGMSNPFGRRPGWFDRSFGTCGLNLSGPEEGLQ